MHHRARFLLLLPAVLVLICFLVLPLGYLVRNSFYLSELGQSPKGAATLANYAELFGDRFYVSIIFKTIWMSVLITASALLAGYPLAYFLWRSVDRWRGVLMVIVLAPLIVSIVVSAYGWTILLGNTGLVNQALLALGLIATPLKMMHTDFAIMIGLTHVVLPFVVLSVFASLERIDPFVREAAQTLGAKKWRVFLHVVLPLSLPGIVSGTTLAFSVSVASYVAPAVLGGSGPNFISTMIYHQLITLMNWPLGSAIAAVLMVVALGLVFAYLRFWSLFGGVAFHGRNAEAR